MDASFFDPLIRTLETLIEAVPHAVLRFRPDSTAVEAVLRDLRGPCNTGHRLEGMGVE